MRTSDRALGIVAEWLRLAAMMIALHALLAIVWIIIDPSPQHLVWPVIVLVVLYLVALALVLWVSVGRINRSTSPPELRHAREHGVSATATVLSIQRTRWRSSSTINFRLRYTPIRREYVMTLRVTAPGIRAYDATTSDYLIGADVPEVGATIPIRIHPERPDVVVIEQGRDGR